MKLIITTKTILKSCYILKRHYCVIALLLTTFVQAQSLNVSAIPTNVGCNTPGSLALSVQNQTLGVPVTYNVYLLPNTAVAVSSGTATTVTNLVAGNYKVTASQTNNGITLTGSTLVQITSPAVTLDFIALGYAGQCGNDGKIEVEVTSGTGGTYEIISGPDTRPQQASPVFHNLSTGAYNVKVTDVCGISVTKLTFIYNTPPIIILPTVLIPLDITPYTVFPGCNIIRVRNIIKAAGSYIPYPVTLKYTAAGTVITQVITSGPISELEVEENIPMSAANAVSYTLEFSHACGSVTSNFGDTIPDMSILAGFGESVCGQKYLTIETMNFTPPYTLTFTSVPAGFNPAALNANYGNPYSNAVIAFGDANNPAPSGLYELTVSDACGRTKNATVSVTPITSPVVSTFNNDCVNQLGRIEATIPLTQLATAIITAVPAVYTGPLPYNVTSFINADGKLSVPGLPIGNYWLTLTDLCGITYVRSAEIHNFTASLIAGETLPDCAPGLGTLKMQSYNPPITSVRINTAPAGFPFPLPYDASAYLSADGGFYMDNLPEGAYYITGFDSCSAQNGRPLHITVTGYTVTENVTEVVTNCATFDYTVKYNGVYTSLWLQKEISPGIWGHPVTLAAYAEGSVPAAVNSVPVTAYQTVTGNTGIGTFRIVRYFKTYGSGVPQKDCIEVLNQFTKASTLIIDKIQVVSCPGPLVDIEVVANGVAPYTFTITQRNGISYTVYNNADPVFTDLDPAIYTFEITDSCGGLIVEDFDVLGLPPVVVANDPGTFTTCDIDNDSIEEFDLTQITPLILGTQGPAGFTVNYFESQNDADNDFHPLTSTYNSAPATIFARVENSVNATCYATIPVNLALYATPILQMTGKYAFCEGSSITITADNGYDAYLWSNGATTQTVTVSQAGQYTVRATDANGCYGTKTIEVVPSPVPVITKVDITDWTNTDNIITILVEEYVEPQYFEYSIDGLSYQDSNTFTGLSSGQYTVYVRDTFGCGNDDKEVFVLTYPKFFTPNGDGKNDTWRVEYAITEPGMTAMVFNRFGKVVYSFDNDDRGWDGTFEGATLPADDYWFVIKRGNGLEFKGHFSLLR